MLIDRSNLAGNSGTHYRDPKPPNLELLKTMICPKCNRKLMAEKVDSNPINGTGSGRVFCICGFSEYYFYKIKEIIPDNRQVIFRPNPHKHHKMKGPSLRTFQCKVCLRVVKKVAQPKEWICSDECRKQRKKELNATYEKKRNHRELSLTEGVGI